MKPVSKTLRATVENVSLPSLSFIPMAPIAQSLAEQSPFRKSLAGVYVVEDAPVEDRPGGNLHAVGSPIEVFLAGEILEKDRP